MAGSLGELFIQLAFEGDTKEADKFIKKTQEVIEKTDKEIKKNKLLLDYLRELKDARNDAEKGLIKKNFAEEFKKLNLTKQLEDAKNKQLAQRNAVIGTAKAIAGYITAISGAIYAVKRLTDSLINQNQTWLNLTRTSDIALSTFQKWNSIGRMYGIDNAAQQIKNLNDRLFELKLTGANAQGFMLAGINPTNADDVMEQLRNRVSGLDDTAASYLLRSMGIDENMLHILRLSRKEFNALNAEVKRFQLTDEQRKDIQNMNVQLQIASMKLQYLKDRIAFAVLPYFRDFMNAIAKTAEALRGFVRWFNSSNPFAGILRILTGITALTAGITIAVKGAVIAFKLWAGAIVLVRGALLALTAHPIIAAITAVIGAIMLLADDVNHYLNGGGRVIGVISKAFEDLRKNGILSDNVPLWIKMLARAADLLYKMFGAGGDGGITGGIKYADIKSPYYTKEELQHRSFISPGAERAIDNSITNNTNNAPKIEFTQHVDINSSQPARDTYNEFQNGLFFANNTLARGAAI